jgi:hypothetical protein
MTQNKWPTSTIAELKLDVIAMYLSYTFPCHQYTTVVTGSGPPAIGCIANPILTLNMRSPDRAEMSNSRYEPTNQTRIKK